MVSPLGCGVDETWNRLLAGQSGGGRITRFDASDLPCQIACEIPRGDGTNGTFNAEQWMDAKEIRRYDDFIIYAMAAAKQAVKRLVSELTELNPSAARSLEEGLEETLTVHRLGVPAQLRKTLASTNIIESAFSVVDRVCGNVKRWHGGDQRERWVGSGLLVAERQFRKVKGHKLIAGFVRGLEAMSPKPPKSPVAKVRKAS